MSKSTQLIGYEVTKGGDKVPVSATTPLPVTMVTDANTDTLEAAIGATNETSAAADNSTSGLNGLIKRLLARLTVFFPAQGADTSGQLGPIVQAAVTTSAPTYTTAKSNPLSLDTTGALRVVDKAAGTAIAPSSVALTTHVGNFQYDVVEADLSLDTNAYADGDVLADTQAITLMASPPAGGMRGEIVGITVLDKDDQKISMDLVVLDANSSLGSENSAPDIDDTEAEDVIAIERVSTYVDLGGASVARPDFPAIPFKVAAGTIWIGAITRGAPTHTASGLRLKIAFRVHNAGLLS